MSHHARSVFCSVPYNCSGPRIKSKKKISEAMFGVWPGCCSSSNTPQATLLRLFPSSLLSLLFFHETGLLSQVQEVLSRQRVKQITKCTIQPNARLKTHTQGLIRPDIATLTDGQKTRPRKKNPAISVESTHEGRVLPVSWMWQDANG